MQRTVKNLVISGLVPFFAFALICASLAVPRQSLASVTGCSQDNRAMEMTDCEHPSYLCGFDPSSTLLSQGAISSTRSNDSLRNLLGLAVGEVCFDSAAYGGSFVGNEHTRAFPVGPHKVSIHLYNSVFTL